MLIIYAFLKLEAGTAHLIVFPLTRIAYPFPSVEFHTDWPSLIILKLRFTPLLSFVADVRTLSPIFGELFGVEEPL